MPECFVETHFAAKAIKNKRLPRKFLLTSESCIKEAWHGIGRDFDKGNCP